MILTSSADRVTARPGSAGTAPDAGVVGRIGRRRVAIVERGEKADVGASMKWRGEDGMRGKKRRRRRRRERLSR